MNLGETINATVTGIVHEAVTTTEGHSPVISLLILLGLISFLTTSINFAVKGITGLAYFIGFIKWGYTALKEKLKRR